MVLPGLSMLLLLHDWQKWDASLFLFSQAFALPTNVSAAHPLPRPPNAPLVAVVRPPFHSVHLSILHPSVEHKHTLFVFTLFAVDADVCVCTAMCMYIKTKTKILHYFCVDFPQIKRDPHQRIVYRPYDTSPTISSMEIKSSSPLLQKLFQTLPAKYKYHQQHQMSQSYPSYPMHQPFQLLNITCEVSILHVYHSSAYANLVMLYPASSHIPNLFNPEKAIGDPDNSPLTAGCSTQPNVYYVIFLILCCFYFGYNSILWHICCI